jgi:transposase
MVRRHISDELKEVALSMSAQGLSGSDICKSIGISERTLRRLRNTYKHTGEVSRKQVVSGRFRMLTSMEAKAFILYLLK